MQQQQPGASHPEKPRAFYRCGACAHPYREAIDEALVSGASINSVAREFGIDWSTASNHRNVHIPELLAERREALAVMLENGTVATMERLETLEEMAAERLDDEFAREELRATIRTGTPLRRLVAELVGKTLAAGSVSITTDLVGSPEYADLVATIDAALAPFPEARAAVLVALAERVAPEALPAGDR